MYMPFPSHRDGEINSSWGVMAAATGEANLFPPEEKDKEPKVLPEAVVSENRVGLSICNYEISL